MKSSRISSEEALRWLESMPLVELMTRANEVRMERHTNDEVTFVMDTNPNYTNVCITNCTFCSFYRSPGHAEAYTLTPVEVARKVCLAVEQGATTVLLQGGHNPDLRLPYYIELIRTIASEAPSIHMHLFSPSEIEHLAESSGSSVEHILRVFWDEGVRSMPGGGAEILVERVRRRISPKKQTPAGWLKVMELAHEIGMKTSATMMYGHLETAADIIEHLDRIRDLQDRTNGFYSFIPWSFKPGASPLSRLVPDEATPGYYLRVIAIARLFLDNVDNVQASWFGEGWRAGQLALLGGANDFGGILIEENVLFEANHKRATSYDAMLETIWDAGFQPVQRTTLYDRVRLIERPTAGHVGNPTRERQPGPMNVSAS